MNVDNNLILEFMNHYKDSLFDLEPDMVTIDIVTIDVEATRVENE